MRAGPAHKAINRDNSTVIGKGDMSVGMSPFFCHFGTRRPHSGIGTTFVITPVVVQDGTPERDSPGRRMKIKVE